MNPVADDIVEVSEAFDILEGRKGSMRTTREVALDAIAAWERVDKALYAHFVLTLPDKGKAVPASERKRAAP